MLEFSGLAFYLAMEDVSIGHFVDMTGLASINRQGLSRTRARAVMISPAPALGPEPTSINNVYDTQGDDTAFEASLTVTPSSIKQYQTGHGTAPIVK